MLQYYSRTLRSRPGQGAPLWPVAFLFVVSLPAMAQPPRATAPADPGWTRGFATRSETITVESAAPVDVRFLFKPGSREHDRIAAGAAGALSIFIEWFGPAPTRQLTIVDAPRNAIARAPFVLGTILVSSRWISSVRDMSLERSLAAGLARQYWTAVTTAKPELAWFQEGLVRYSAARAINEMLDGRHLQTYRYFGGFVPHTVRAISLTRQRRDPRPMVRWFPELHDAPGSDAAAWLPPRDAAEAAADTLGTLERHIGWPSMQQALAELVRRHARGGAAPEDLVDLIRELRGEEITWLFSRAPRAPDGVDYRVEHVATGPADRPSSFETTVRARREGSAPFAVPVVTAFADGTRVRESWPPGSADFEVSYSSSTPAVSASVDPDAVVLVDSDRSNNTFAVSTPFSRLAVRATLNWLIWLQDLVLTCTALV